MNLLRNRMKYIVILVFLVSCSTKVDKKKNETKEQLISQIVSKEKGEPVTLQKLSLLKGKLSVDLPKGFGLMSKEMLAAKYPANNRPTLVYTNDNGTVNFAFNHTANKLPKNRLKDYLPAFVKQFGSIYPNIEWFDKKVKKIDNRDFIVLEFITPAIDSKIYNLMHITVLEGRMLMCTFNCTESQKNEWETKAKESLKSIVIKE
jgi:hypothetical protein